MTAPNPASAPGEVIELLARGLLTQAVLVAARLGIPELVADGPRSDAELAEATGSDPAAVARLTRALTALGVLARAADGRLAATPLSRPLEGGPVRAYAALVGDVLWELWGALDHSVRTGGSAFRHVHGEALFEHLARDPALAAAFQGWMTAQSRMQTPQILEAVDLDDVGWVVDVGGGHGALLGALLEAHPRMRGTLVDRPEIVAGAALGPDGRAEAVAGDFFEAVPAGADRYLLKFILHDWDDERCLAILGAIRRAIPPHGRLLVLEALLPEHDGYAHAVWLDINMLVVTEGGRERTAAGYEALLTRAGFALERIAPTSGLLSVLEAAPAD